MVSPRAGQPQRLGTPASIRATEGRSGMGQQSIRYRILANGRVEEEVIGVQGAACQALTGAIEASFTAASDPASLHRALARLHLPAAEMQPPRDRPQIMLHPLQQRIRELETALLDERRARENAEMMVAKLEARLQQYIGEVEPVGL